MNPLIRFCYSSKLQGRVLLQLEVKIVAGVSVLIVSVLQANSDPLWLVAKLNIVKTFDELLSEVR